MKKIVTLIGILMLCVIVPSNGYAQQQPASCITFPNNPYLVSPVPGTYYVKIDGYLNPTSGVKTFNVTVTTQSGAPCFTECVTETDPGPGDYTSMTFPCAGIPVLTVISYSGNAQQLCSGAPCVTFTTLPVKFKSFTASRSGANVSLKWSTATEQNNSGFKVERNTNGAWEEISFVPSQASGGNSDNELSYSYTDNNPTKGMSQYRLRQVDFDQKSALSEIRAVRGDGQLGGVTIMPNPSARKGTVTLVFDDAAMRSVTVTDMSGRIVMRREALTVNNLTIEGLSSGMYSVKVFKPETAEWAVGKIMVQ